MTLSLVLEESVPVEEVESGMRLILPRGGRVTVDRVDVYDTLGEQPVSGFIVRWWRRAEHGEPGHRGGKQHAGAIDNEWDGRYYGSLIPFRAGETVRIARA